MFSLIDMLGRACPVIDIVDVGALWMGEQDLAYRALLKHDRFRLIGFEPVAAECDKLNAMGRKGQRFLPYFIGDGTEREFRLNNAPMTSSLYEPNRRLVDRFAALGELMIPQTRERVRTTRLDDIPDIDAIDFLKLDIQGGELDALRGAARHLQRAVVIETEVEFVPLYEGQPLFAELDQELRRHGFLLHALPGTSGRTFRPLRDPSNPAATINQVLWADAVYVKDFSRLAVLSAEQLLRMAVIVHEVYGSVDLAALCLQHYDAKTKAGLWQVYIQRVTGATTAPAPPPLE
ncbi:MAG: FkbM family methyltransferase [Phycisphaerae bacterium]|nr:FkbM family methyltransferase [Phycisphaerae bacterium]